MIVRIKSKRPVYRRCGIAHTKAATDHPADRFTEAELERLQADPVLTVELLDGELPDPDAGGGSTSADPGKDAKPAAAATPAKAPAAKAAKAGGSAKAAAKKPATKAAAKPAAAPATAPQPAVQDGEQKDATPPADPQGGEA
jgi:hypothetical protein